MSNELEDSMISLETAVLNETQELEKKLQAEEQRIMHLQSEQEFLRTETERLQNDTSKLDEEIRDVYGRFTSTREKCKGLKRLSQCLEANIMELQKKLLNETARTDEEKSQFNKAVDMYQQKWYEYRDYYEKHPLVPKLNEAKRKMNETESYLSQLQSELQMTQSKLFKVKNKIENAKNSAIYSSLNKYIIELAKMKTRAIRNQLRVKATRKEINKLRNASLNKECVSSRKTAETPTQSNLAEKNSSAPEALESVATLMKQQDQPGNKASSEPPFRTPKFQLYIPKFASTPKVTSASSSISTGNVSKWMSYTASRKNSPTLNSTHEEKRNDESCQMETYQTPENNDNTDNPLTMDDSLSLPSSFGVDIDIPPPPSKSPGFTYSSRFMFSQTETEGDSTNALLPTFSALSSKGFDSDVESCTDVSVSKDSSKLPKEQPFYFEHSPRMSPLVPPSSHKSILSLFGNSENSGRSSPVSSGFSFDFAKSSDVQPPRDTFQFSF